MLYVIFGIVLLLLSLAGILAYQNSQLISQRKTTSSSRSPAHRYIVVNQSISGIAEEANLVPLFQFTVLHNNDGLTSVNVAGSTIILCKVPEGTGEMVLADAQNLMLKYIKHAADQGTLMSQQTYSLKETDHAEKELIMNLEDAMQRKGRMEC